MLFCCLTVSLESTIRTTSSFRFFVFNIFFLYTVPCGLFESFLLAFWQENCICISSTLPLVYTGWQLVDRADILLEKLREERDYRSLRRRSSHFRYRLWDIVRSIGTTVRRSAAAVSDSDRWLEASRARSTRRRSRRRWRLDDVVWLGRRRRLKVRPHGDQEMQTLQWTCSRVCWPVAFRLTTCSQPTNN